MARTALILLLLLAVPTHAQRATDRPARELLLEAGVTLIVEPVDPREPGKVTVVEVLRGDKVKAGDVIDATHLAEALTTDNGPDWRILGQALLFGTPGDKPSAPFQLLPTGIRLTTMTGKVWQAVAKPTGGFRLVARPNVEWDRLVRQLRDDRAEILALEAIRNQPTGSRRNRALLAWIERHPPVKVPSRSIQPGEPLPVEDLGQLGWGELEIEPVRWILRAGIVEDSWEALTLYARLHEGALIGRDCFPFAAPEGRAFLLRQVKEERSLVGAALRALKILAWPETYPADAVPAATFARKPSDAERTQLLEEIRPLLTKNDLRWKQAAARALVAILSSAEKVPPAERQGVVTDLEAQLKTATPGATRNVLAEALFRVAPEGRTPLALLLDLDRREVNLHFWLAVYPEGGIVPEVPTLLVERVQTGGKAETVLEVPLACPAPPDWKTGWDTRRPLFVEVPLAKFKSPATYRLTVRGVVGPDRKNFVSEPRTFQVVANPSQPALFGRVVLDEE